MTSGKKDNKEKTQQDQSLQNATTVRINLDPKTMERLASMRPLSNEPPTRRIPRVSRVSRIPTKRLSEEAEAEEEQMSDDNPFQRTTTMWIDLTKPGGQQVKHLDSELPKKSSAAWMSQPNAAGDPGFRELLECIYDGCLITDRKGIILSVNARAIHYFRRKEASFCGAFVMDIFSGATPTLLSTIWETLNNDQFVLLQAECIRADRSTFPAEISVNRFHLADDMCFGFFIRDVTLRKETEDRLKTGYNAIQNSGDGIVMANKEACIGNCNPTALALLGFDAVSQIRGQSFAAFLADKEMAKTILHTVQGEEKIWRGELRLLRQDGESWFAQMSVAPNLNVDGALVGMVVSFLDVTEQKKTQQKLEKYATELSERNRQLANDLEMAKGIHQVLLPRTYPVFPATATVESSALRFEHVYIPSHGVGGDFFNLRRISNTHAGIFISDVMGHGMRAALVTATLRGLIEELSSVAHDPAVFLTQLNQAYMSIFSGLDEEMLFTTAAYLVVDTISGRVRYSNAGHPLPLLLSRNEERMEELVLSDDAMGAGIGLFSESVYGCDERVLSEGDVLLLYTDGLLEATNEDGVCYEDGAFEASVRSRLSLKPRQLLDELIADARSFSGCHDFIDDVCVLSMEVARLGLDR